MVTVIKSSLQANQLLAGLQKREPKLYQLIRAIISDLENQQVVIQDNSDAITAITGGGTVGSGLNHGQVMKRIAGAT